MLKSNLIIKILLFICKVLDFVLYRKPSNKIPIFLYHSISDKKSRLSVDSEEFENQMKYLSEQGYQSISPLELKNDKSDKSFMITFDDGFQDNLKMAMPILRKYNFKATVFISTKYIGEKSAYATKEEDKKFNIMTKSELQEIEVEGWLVANHFHSHTNLIDLVESEIVKEMNDSCEALDKIVKNKEGLNIYSYPRNKYNQEIKNIIKEKGATMAFAGERRFFSPGDDVYALPRIEIDRDVSFDKFRLYLSYSYFFIRNKIFKK